MCGYILFISRNIDQKNQWAEAELTVAEAEAEAFWGRDGDHTHLTLAGHSKRGSMAELNCFRDCD